MSYKEYEPVHIQVSSSPVDTPDTKHLDIVDRYDDFNEEEKGGGGGGGSESRTCCSCVKSIFSVGCAVAVVTCSYFFIIIPAGVLLILHGYHKGSILTLSLGAGLLFVVTCALPAVWLGIRYRRSKREFSPSSIKERHRKLTETGSDGQPAVILKSKSPLRGSCKKEVKPLATSGECSKT